MSSRVRELSSDAPARLPTAHSGPFYGAVLFMLVVAVVVGALLFSYGYLAANAEAWADDGGGPGAAPVATAVAATIAAAVVLGIAKGSVAHDAPPTAAISGLLAVAVLELAGTGALAWAIADLPQSRSASSFAASTWLLLATALALAVLCAAAAGLTATWLARGHEGNVSAVESVRIVAVLVWSSAVLVPLLAGTAGFGGGWW